MFTFVRNRCSRSPEYAPVTVWPCGLYLSQSFMGSRPFASTAAAWAVMNYLGEEGYIKNARQILQVKDRIQEAVKNIEGLSSWDTHGPLMMIKGEGLDIQLVTGAMRERGWVLLGVLDPCAVHLTIDPTKEEDLNRFVQDIEKTTAAVRDGEYKTQGSLNYGGAGGSSAPQWLQEAMIYMENNGS